MSEDMDNNLYLSYYPQSVAASNGQCSSIHLNNSEVAAISKINHRRIGGLKDEECRLLGKVVFALQTAINT
nr:hypothetical protein [uncultured Mediterranean phage uvMED]